jgi:Fic family protein
MAMEDMGKRFGGLPSRLEAEEIWRNIWREETHNSTAIEGNTLVQREVDELLESGLTGRRNKRLEEFLEVRGYADAAGWVYETGIDPAGDWSNGDLLSMHDVRRVHAMSVALAWQVAPPEDATAAEGPGSWREHDIQEFKGGMKPPDWPLVPAEMQRWVEEVDCLRDLDEPYPIADVARLHADFERIHPFLDGNGRAGRLLTNLVLVRLGMPPAIIYKRDRDTYLLALRRADTGDVGMLAELLARAVLNNLNRLMLPALAGPARLVPIAALVTDEISHGALRSAAARGALKAQQDGLGQWLSSQLYVEQYLAQRNSRRGRPKEAERAHRTS